jgi:uncharacterized membrane protein
VESQNLKLGIIEPEKESRYKLDFFYSWLPIVLILITVSIFYFFNLDEESLWLDEFFSIRDANRITDLDLKFYIKNSRLLYFILLKIWMVFDQSAFWLRSLSVIFALGSVFATYLLGRHLIGKNAALFASLLLGISPLFVNHAQEVRMYTLGTLFVLAGTIFLVYALEKPTQLNINCWAVSRLALLFIAPLNAVILVPDSVLILIRFRRDFKSVIRFGWRILFISVFKGLPTVYLIYRSASGSNYVAEESRIDLGVPEILSKFYNLTIGGVGFDYTTYLPLYSLAFAAVILILLAVANLSNNSIQNDKANWLLIWTIFSILIFYVGAHKSDTLWYRDRYLLFISPYLCLLVAQGLVKLSRIRLSLAIVITFAYFLIVSSNLFTYYSTQTREDWRIPIEFIKSHYEPGDLVAVYPNFNQYAVQYYYSENEFMHIIEHEGSYFDIPELSEAIQSIAKPDISRIWLISRADMKELEKLQEILEQTFDVVSQVYIEDRINLYLIESSI